MKRYTEKSKIKKVKIKSGGKGEVLFVEIIKEASKKITKDKKESFIGEVSDFVAENWGVLEEDYIHKGVVDSYLCLLVRNEKRELVAISCVKRYKIFGREIYFFGLTVIKERYRRISLLRRMYLILGERLFLENIPKGRTKVEALFITSDIRILKLVAQNANFSYPNPYHIDIKTGKIPDADTETWDIVREFLKINNEKYRSLSRHGCIMEGFYDDKQHLLQKERIESKEAEITAFSKKYLPKNGEEAVVRAIFSPKAIFYGRKG